MLIIGLKYPSARRAFVSAFQSSRGSLPKRVYLALAGMALHFKQEKAYTALRGDIDAIKGTARVHGMCVYLQRLGVVQQTSASTGIRLGAGPSAFVVNPYSHAIGKRIQGFIRLSPTLDSLEPAWSLQTYNRNQNLVLAKLSELRVCQLSSGVGLQYNRQFSFRMYQLSESRCLGIQRLAYLSTDVVGSLPGPDGKGVRRIIGAGRPVADLYEKEGVKVFPEYVCAAACLGSGRYREALVSKREARRRLAIGPRCAACKAGRRGAKYCRIKQRHTAPAAGRG